MNEKYSQKIYIIEIISYIKSIIIYKFQWKIAINFVIIGLIKILNSNEAIIFYVFIYSKIIFFAVSIKAFTKLSVFFFFKQTRYAWVKIS